ncbi:3-oxoacyl-(acyl-carrier-protein) reductase [Beggiatoa sp. PS]|nr:3-oxoacyl-(acyl-carrier-protein) reductase [Beggiatoa sp. PS]
MIGEGKVLDIASPDSINALMASLEKHKPTILVNNAAITRDTLLMRMSDEQWYEVINANLTGVYRLSKACLRAMMKGRHGRIITITSVVGLTGNPGQTNYAAAKAGVIAFSKSLAREIGSRGITVNTVAPGFIDTDMTRRLPEEQRTAILQQIPLARAGEANDVANAVVFLASKAAAYITGETLHLNGGMYMP